MSDWKDKIRKDLVPFANSNTKLDCLENGDEFIVTWVARNKKLTASFRIVEEKINVTFESVSMSYSSFLASPSMSDMLGIAGMILQMHEESFFVDTKAKNPESVDNSRSAIRLLSDEVINQEQGSTNVLFVNADAGAGKTEVLKQLVFDQADKYIKGDANFLYLYVNAQGRALAKLDEALATEIQDLRASNLTYHVVPTLTRNNIIVPIIDGFDELLGVMGYEDSFSSLRRFLAELHGQGCLIASARSTYFQQEFLSRANRPSSGLGGITISQIDIQPWQDEELDDFLDKRFHQEPNPQLKLEPFKSAMVRIFSADKNAMLKTKPFFLSAAAALLLSGVSINEDDLLEQLVGGFIERERSEKLLDKHGKSLLSVDQIRQFLQLVSEEMWAGEVRSLDRETIKEIADLAFDANKIGPDVSRILQERASTMAFFTNSTHRDGVEFEHQLFFSYFLGESIAALAISNSDELFRTLVRATLPDGVASSAARRLVATGRAAADIVNECNGVARRGSIRPLHLRENAGALIAEFIREDGVDEQCNEYEGLRFSGIVFAGIVFPQVAIVNSSFLDVEFRRSDLSKCEIKNCVGKDLILQDITVNPSYTSLDINGVSLDSNVFGLRVRQEGRIRPIFRLSEVRKVLSQCSFPGINDAEPIRIDDNILALVEKLFRKFDRSNVFWPTDDVNRNITQDENWDKLMGILISSGLVVQERVSAQSGAPRPHLRLTVPSEVVVMGQIQSGKVPEQVQNFWDDLKSEWPAN
ncbi:hypothetical protein HNR00_002499 [Methylorubrum rhodinum]|uniref:NACHT domain-containing protein n=1 Tax=Methylorubrum rhodinum TaxID=29428 RepID=A0A840ZLX2_9HYPH|nr:hypothetical protein [Methylorubrum rhodinum]MBB5757783.1 hypothetical protein [Methylorubrum rhodinum]